MAAMSPETTGSTLSPPLFGFGPVLPLAGQFFVDRFAQLLEFLIVRNDHHALAIRWTGAIPAERPDEDADERAESRSDGGPHGPTDNSPHGGAGGRTTNTHNLFTA